VIPVYVIHPVELRFPGMSSFKDDIAEVIAAEPSWRDWEIVWISMDPQNWFRISDVASRIGTTLGPVVIFSSAQGPVREQLRSKLQAKTVVVVTSGSESTALWQDIETAKQYFLAGEPLLPRKLVLAVLLVRKLIAGNYWGGSHEKKFIWVDELAKGRGVDESFKDIAKEVANILTLKGVLIPKYGGNRPKRSRQKYAVNPERRHDVLALANECECSDSELMRLLRRDPRLISARELDD